MSNPLQPAEAPKTMTDYVYTQLREDIIQGKLAPDSKLKIEQLRGMYDVGATPIREALSRLSADGFVLMEGQRGFRVSPISPEDLEDVTELRITLELKALRNSILHGGDDWESRVVSTYYQLSKVEELDLFEHIDAWEQRNHDFHWALISACTSKWLLHFYNTLYDQHKRYRNISLVANLGQRDVHAEHKRIYDAALARDADTACRETEEHIRVTAEITRQVLVEEMGKQSA
ncbi:GntR family transcriptional regulator [Thiothrix nivea]|uniref:Transcriptional regulator, GntR family n=1 Tax=Thiothrix nivea (strain ATCC 35100 / DSM 5205 / JP2) TaxID=870187 RepID=A0A656HKE6_THINJ|nr:FCD domain-containing protein [Thiothrix nivea]EIJ36753.1 transcriptional regulator, GntR family [Thiothrix nivea DSM 5205]